MNFIIVKAMSISTLRGSQLHFSVHKGQCTVVPTRVDFCVITTLTHFVKYLEPKVLIGENVAELLLIPYLCTNHTEIESRYIIFA